MSTVTIGLLGLALLLILLLASMPVGFCLAVVGALGFLAVVGNPLAAYHLIVTVFYETFGNYDFTVIPLFILMGQIAFHSGISKRLFDTAYKWCGRLPGGLAVATVGACTAFGAICGSGPATAATMSAVALPEMRKRGYSLRLGAGTIAAGGSLGMLIPPSVVFIVYGIMTEISPAKLFLAGIIPGLMLALMFSAYICLTCLRHPELGPVAPACSWKERLKSLGGVVEILLLFVLVMGGLFVGWFTPTEAAAVGALGSLAIAACRRVLTVKMLVRSLLETIRTSCMVLTIIAGAMIFSRFLAVTGIPAAIAEALTSVAMPPWLTLACILIFFIMAGTVVDNLALVLMTIPIFYPVILKLGFDPVWFGTVIVVVVQIGVISPPVGVNAYVVSGMIRDIPLSDVFRGCLPFLWILMLGTVLLILFPSLALWLPSL